MYSIYIYHCICGEQPVRINLLIHLQGFIYPSVFTLLGLWAPAEERGRLSGFVMGGQSRKMVSEIVFPALRNLLPSTNFQRKFSALS